ncbi:MAG: DUF4349 domain-containing protein [Ruminococcaceae bacterium]|nr:DUF4349 domain-containing protein [Oscillospiraceae bacterium]NLC73327.1 DUF4349 domain-containing protein [Oscillospiraceae bacterium]
MKTNKRRISALIIAIVLLTSLVLSACGSKNSASVMPGEGYYGGYADRDGGEEKGMLGLKPQDAPAAKNDSAGESKPQDQSNMPAKPGENTKIVYTASIEIDTTEFETAEAKLKELVAKNQGYFEQEQSGKSGSYRRLSCTVRVPADNFKAFTESVGEVGQVNTKNIYAEDIAESYYDTEIRLGTQKTKLERLQKLLAEAKDMQDIITIESAISETEVAIERLTGTMRRYDSLVGFSTVSISLREVSKLSGEAVAPIGFGQKLLNALKNGISSFVEFLEDLIIDIAYNWVGLLVTVIIAILLYKLIKKGINKRRGIVPSKKKKNKQEEPEVKIESPAENQAEADKKE